MISVKMIETYHIICKGTTLEQQSTFRWIYIFFLRNN